MRKTAWIFLFSLLLFLCACGEPASDNWEGFDLSKGTQLTHLDTHGGFHGDGAEFSVWQFDADYSAERAKALNASNGWSSLPLTETLQSAIYGTDAGAVSYGPCLADEDGNALFPAVVHGYYYFYDRSSESSDPKDDTNLLSRYSFNFTFAIFDTDKNTLYYSTLDT